MSANDQRSPVVTLASLFGAGGSVVGPRVAERLGVPFLDRAIPEAVAKQPAFPKMPSRTSTNSHARLWSG